MSHRILIVDDEAGIRQALKQVLEYEDLVVRVTASGGEAITVYSEFRPHLVFLDVKMVECGDELARRQVAAGAENHNRAGLHRSAH